jgi:hypothetical protein
MGWDECGCTRPPTKSCTHGCASMYICMYVCMYVCTGLPRRSWSVCAAVLPGINAYLDEAHGEAQEAVHLLFLVLWGWCLVLG